MRKNKKAAIRPCLSPLLFSVLDVFSDKTLKIGYFSSIGFDASVFEINKPLSAVL